MGDAVYEILVRERIVHRANMPVNKLHLQAVEQVRASYQSRAYAVIEPLLSEEEQAALKEGAISARLSRPKTERCRITDALPDWSACSAIFICRGKLTESTSCLKKSNKSWNRVWRTEA